MPAPGGACLGVPAPGRGVPGLGGAGLGGCWYPSMY